MVVSYCMECNVKQGLEHTMANSHPSMSKNASMPRGQMVKYHIMSVRLDILLDILLVVFS